MKVVNIMLEDAEHKRMMEEKGSSTWKDALEAGCRDLSEMFTNKMNE